jgi:hypothetical protein
MTNLLTYPVFATFRNTKTFFISKIKLTFETLIDSWHCDSRKSKLTVTLRDRPS